MDINLFEFEFYSEEEGENIEVCYYTYTDNSELSKCQFSMDEPGTHWDTLTHGGTITEETMIEWFGSLDMVLDKDDKEALSA